MEKGDHFRASTEKGTLLYSRETTLQYSRETTLLHSREALLLLLLPLQKNVTINALTVPPEKGVRFIWGLISGRGRDTIRNA